MYWAAMDAETRDRARGALFGLAVGDALGTTLEFAARDTLPHHAAMTGGGPFRLPPGTWTDDTSMALALADSLLACGGFDARDLMERFLRWLDHGEYSPTGRCFDIGTTTRAALERFRRTGNPFAGPVDEHTAGNGSLMRLAPAVLWTLDDPDACRTLAREQGRTTHGAPQAVDACAALADKLRRAVMGESKGGVLAPEAADAHPAVRAVAAGSWRGKDRAAISSSGYAVHTLEAALWCVDRTGSFADALVLAVNLADDADTVGAVTGQLAGAVYGASAIPQAWLAPLAWRERLMAAADGLAGRPESQPAER